MTKDEAILRLLEECYSIKEERAMDRIENLLNGLYPIVKDSQTPRRGLFLDAPHLLENLREACGH